MKPILFFIVSILFILILNTGCQQEVPSDILNDTTHTANASVLQKIKVHHPSTSDPLDVVISLQYDTANRKINVYVDDTTTSNPFDLLAVNYQFDANGYLISSNSTEYNGVLQPDFVITRNSSGQIQKIIEYNAEDDNGIPYNDTVYYSYEPSAGQTVVQDSVRFHFSTTFVTRRTTYDFQNKPVSEYFPSGSIYTDTTKYNYSNGMLSSIFYPYDTTGYTYDNTPIATEWQSWPQLLLGRDYYVLQQPPLTLRLSYTFLSFIMEHDFETVYNPLLTKPLSKIVVRGYPSSSPNNLLVKTISFSYTYNSDRLPVTISVLPEGDDPTYYSFEYR